MKDSRPIKFVSRSRKTNFYSDTIVLDSSVNKPKDNDLRYVRVFPTNFCRHDDGSFFAGALTNAAIMFHYGDVISFIDDDFGEVGYDNQCFLDLGEPKYIKHWSDEPFYPKPLCSGYIDFVRAAYEILGASKAVQLGTCGKPVEVAENYPYFTGNPLAAHCTQGFSAKKEVKTFWFTPSILDTKLIKVPTLPYTRHEDSWLGFVNQVPTIVLPAFIQHIGARKHLREIEEIDYLVQKKMEQFDFGISNPELKLPRTDDQIWLEENYLRLCLECEQLKTREEKVDFVEEIFFHGSRL